MNKEPLIFYINSVFIESTVLNMVLSRIDFNNIGSMYFANIFQIYNRQIFDKYICCVDKRMERFILLIFVQLRNTKEDKKTNMKVFTLIKFFRVIRKFINGGIYDFTLLFVITFSNIP